MNITQTLEKWGNSQGVRLPKKVIEAARLGANTRFNVNVKGHIIILTPVNQPRRLEELLEGVTPSLIGGEFNYGQDVGYEKIA